MRSNNQIETLQELCDFVGSIPSEKISFYCNACLFKKGIAIPSTWNTHGRGLCEGGCNHLNDISVPAINAKVLELGLTQVPEINEIIWGSKLKSINTSRREKSILELD